jgi:nitrous oxide reductase accessory protein NosL
MKTKFTYYRVVVLMVFASIIVLAPGCRRIEALFHSSRCVLSNRPIHANVAVRVAVDGGPRGEACCLRCAITYAQQYRKRVRVLWVTDYTTGRRLDPERATYVTGSDVNRCMGPPDQASASRRETDVIVWDRCSPSSIAFARRNDAAAFQRIHGGRIQTFAEVIGAANVVATR